jgi:chemotaxis methyl-accepting protein methylase
MSSNIARGWLRPYLSINRRIWVRLPASIRFHFPGRVYGRHLHSLVCMNSERNQNHSTFFLRNRPELQLMCRLLDQKPHGSSLDLSVFACSKGAEVYSILWAIRSARPDLKVHTNALDISQEIVEFAKKGVYSKNSLEVARARKHECVTEVRDATWVDQNVSIFERLTDSELESLFEINGDQASIRPWLRENITWRTADANAPELPSVIAPQDIVVANRFLCHMDAATAEKCLRNIARVVKPGGYLFVSGIDLDVRTKVARSLNWKPVPEQLKEVHEGDISIMNGWPLEWWGVEPFCKDLPDWRIRYAAVFQIGDAPLR